MLQLKNETPFRAALSLFPDPEGVDTLYVTVRGAFELGERMRVAEDQPAVRAADVHWGAPDRSSLRYAGELHPRKPSTDVVLVGDAWAPRGRPVTELEVGIVLGPIKKGIVVLGDRRWQGLVDARLSAPEPFERMPLRYERAFGGVVETDPSTMSSIVDDRNPAGVGFALHGRGGAIGSRRLPNLEDPLHRLRHPTDRPPPAGFGFLAPSWEPRRSRAGTYDASWRRTRAPYLPLDFQPRFFNAAHPDLVCPGYLEGGEQVDVLHASPSPLLRFRLPVCRFDASARVAGRIERPPLALETVLIEPDEGRLTLLWRGAVRVDKRALAVGEVRLGLASLSIEGRAA